MPLLLAAKADPQASELFGVCAWLVLAIGARCAIETATELKLLGLWLKIETRQARYQIDAMLVRLGPRFRLFIRYFCLPSCSQLCPGQDAHAG